jgi:hypothetical protein
MTTATLTGTEKQIAYAAKIREKVTGYMDGAVLRMQEKTTSFSDQARAELHTAYVTLIEEILTTESSVWWIETADTKLIDDRETSTYIMGLARSRGMVPTVVKEIDAKRAARN